MICLLGGPQTTMGRGFHSWWAGARLTTTTAAIARYCCTTSSTSIFQTGLCSAKAEGQPKSWIISIVDIVPKKEVFLSAFILQFYAQKRGEKGTAFFSSHQKKNLIFSFSLFFWFQMLFSKSWQSPIKPFLLLPLFVLAEKCHRQVSWILEEKRASLNSHSRGR